MGSSKSVPTPAPIIIKGPTAEEIAAEKEEEAADMRRGRHDAALARRRMQNVNSLSRDSGFAGSGVYIPGGSA